MPEDEYLVPLVKAEAKREGSDVTPIPPSLMLHKTFSAAEQLAEDGINAEVIDLRAVAPLGHDELARSVQKKYRPVVMQEAVELAGMASQVIKSLTVNA